jgi:hypothetical protein
MTLCTLAFWLLILCVALPHVVWRLYGMLLVLCSPLILLCKGIEALGYWLYRDNIRQRREAEITAKLEEACKRLEYFHAATRWRAPYGHVRHFLTPVHLPQPSPEKG